MKQILLEKIRLKFVCEDHNTTIDVDPSDVVTCGVPLCQICNEEMSIEEHADVDIWDD